MTDAFIPHTVDAYQDPGRRGWIARYSAPGIGVQRVKDGAGLVRLFATEQAAMLAAIEAKNHAENQAHRGEKAARSLGNQVFRVFGQGRGRILIPAGARR